MIKKSCLNCDSENILGKSCGLKAELIEVKLEDARKWNLV